MSAHPSPDFLAGFAQAKEMAARLLDKHKVGDELRYGNITEKWLARAIRGLTPPERLSKGAPEPTNEKAG